MSTMMTVARVCGNFLRLQRLAIGLAGCFFLFFAAMNIASALGCEPVEGARWYITDMRKCVTIGKGTPVNTVLGTICECSIGFGSLALSNFLEWFFSPPLPFLFFLSCW